MRLPASTLVFLLLSPVVSADDDTPVRFEVSSGTERNALVELYTSEGCSSCPPADRWLSTLEDDPRLWTEIVPVALHVDYWDYIGWTDRFAAAGYGQRQKRLAVESGALSVYTPGMFTNGEEWLGWRRGSGVPRDGKAAGELELSLAGDTLSVSYRSGSPLREGLVVNVGLLGMNLSTEVRAGENRGRRLEHDFVLLSLSEAVLHVHSDGRSASVSIVLDDVSDSADALIAWVSDADGLTPLQATGGYLAAR